MTPQQKYSQFIHDNNKEPLYAEASVRWLDTGETVDGMIFKLSDDADCPEDDLVFYYVTGLPDLLSLTTKGTEDFIILSGSIRFLEHI